MVNTGSGPGDNETGYGLCAGVTTANEGNAHDCADHWCFVDLCWWYSYCSDKQKPLLLFIFKLEKSLNPNPRSMLGKLLIQM